MTLSEIPEAAVRERAEQLFRRDQELNFRRTDRLFAWLMAAQWGLALAMALFYSPYTWKGKESALHAHVYMALLIGGGLSLYPVLLAALRPGRWRTRLTVACCQVMTSAILIHITGGRIETHFHIFGSLAFLAFYRDWKLYVPATSLVAADHLVRGLWWPESVFGLLTPEWWRFLEHSAWVGFEVVFLLIAIERANRLLRLVCRRQAELEAARDATQATVDARTQELEEQRELYRGLIETVNVVPWEFDVATREFTYVGPQVSEVLGYTDAQRQDTAFLLEQAHPDDLPAFWSCVAEARAGVDFQLDSRIRAAGGEYRNTRHYVRASDEGGLKLRGVLLDVTEETHLREELKQAQKLESVGRLASGVAHEINTPIQFVNDNLHFLREGYGDLFRLLQAYEGAAQEGLPDATRAELAALAEEVDLEFLRENIPESLDSSLEGAARVAEIVKSMKSFAHPGSRDRVAVHLNEAIHNTVTIAKNEYKYVADLELELGDIPDVLCDPGEVNQVLLNLIVNAAHAIGERTAVEGGRGTIRVGTAPSQGGVEVRIGDTGNGIPEEIQGKIFEPFFTTKEVGRGTGQGLALARSIMEKLGGRIGFSTEAGVGTTFSLWLPAATGSDAQEIRTGRRGSLVGVT